MYTQYLKHSANVDRRLLQSTVEQRSRKVDAPQCLVAVENGCHGDDTVGIDVGVGKSEMCQSSIDLYTKQQNIFSNAIVLHVYIVPDSELMCSGLIRH